MRKSSKRLKSIKTYLKRKVNMREECVFCNEEKLEGKIIFSNVLCKYIELDNKILIGSGIIITQRHRKTIFDVILVEWISFFFMMRKVRKYMEKKYKPDGYNIGWNINEVGGQEVYHVHMHIIPRYFDEPYAGRGIRYWIKKEENTRESMKGEVK